MHWWVSLTVLKMKQTLFNFQENDDEDDESGYYTCRSTAHGSLDRCNSQSRSMWSRDRLMKRIEEFNLNNHGLQMNMDLVNIDYSSYLPLSWES